MSIWDNIKQLRNELQQDEHAKLLISPNTDPKQINEAQSTLSSKSK